MIKKTKKLAELTQYDIRDNLKNRNLVMFIDKSDATEFEKCKCFYRQVEMASKIIDKDTQKIYKNRITG